MSSLYLSFSIVLFCLLLNSPLRADSKDPFKDFKYHILQNGLKVVLAPHQNAKNVQIKLLVNTGYRAEKINNLQANHLLEHMLFRDGSILDDKTYLQLIEEKGGKVNGFSGANEVGYVTKISADKLNWTLEQFKKMVFNRELGEKSLKLAKSSVELEIGEAGLISRTLGVDIFGLFHRSYFPKKNFFEKEFGITPYKFTRDEESLSLKNLTLSNVLEIYNNYYYPSNMSLLISGNFEVENLLLKVKELFEGVPDRDGETLTRPSALVGLEDSLNYSPSYSNAAVINIGKKLFENDVIDSFVIDSYLEYIAHNVMIDLRNKKGETYTARAFTIWDRNYGYSYLHFETPLEKYEQNLNYIKDQFNNDVYENGLKDFQIAEAKDLYLKQNFEIEDVDADSLMQLAHMYFQTTKSFKAPASPYGLLSNLSNEEYKNRLNKIFTENGDFEQMVKPPMFFKFDTIVIFFLSLVFGVFLFKLLFNSKKPLVNIKWEFKSTHSLGYIYEVCLLSSFALISFIFIYKPYNYALESMTISQSVYYPLYYLSTAITSTLLSFLFVAFYSTHRKSLLFSNGSLYLNHLAFRRKKIERAEIESIYLVSAKDKISKPTLYLKLSFWLSSIFDYFFLRDSLAIKLKSGKTYYLNFKDASLIKEAIENEYEMKIISSECKPEVISDVA